MSDTNWFTEKLDNLEKKMEQLEIDKEFFKKEYIQINEKYLKVLEMLQQTQTKVKQYKEVLEWYANPKTYKRAGNGEYVIMMDKGWNARQVLEVGEVRKMNDKTRLQEIKENFTLMNNFAELCQTGTCTLSLKDYDWLISQLERLQKENETLSKRLERRDRQISFLEDKLYKIADLTWKFKQLKQLGDPTLWGVYEIEKYRELI